MQDSLVLFHLCMKNFDEQISLINSCTRKNRVHKIYSRTIKGVQFTESQTLFHVGCSKAKTCVQPSDEPWTCRPVDPGDSSPRSKRHPATLSLLPCRPWIRWICCTVGTWDGGPSILKYHHGPSVREHPIEGVLTLVTRSCVFDVGVKI